MYVYLGDLHSHTGYSGGAVGTTPAQAFAAARANGLHFFAVTEHDFLMSPAEWVDLQNQANAATIPGQFVALPGFEYVNQYGHLNVFDSDTYISGNDPNYDTLAEFYDWLVSQPMAFAQFNHPMKQPFDLNFNDFAYHPQADLKIVLQELQTTDQFLLSLNTGWHLGSVKNSDTHVANWGCCSRTALLAPSLTKEAILEALRARRTFFVSPSDWNLALVMQANGYWMGSSIPNTTAINFTINVYDPDPRGKPLRLAIYNNGIPVASISLSSRPVYTWQPTIAGQLGHYYYAEAYYERGLAGASLQQSYLG
jgi:predicted metal-dependent phosphoesterase TrpH